MEATAATIHRPGNRRSSPALGRALVLLAAVAVLVDLGASTAGGAWVDPLYPLTYYLALLGLLAVGALLMRTPPQRANAQLMFAVAGSSAFLDLLLYWQDAGPAPFLSNLVYWYVAGLFAHLLLRWPGDRLPSWLHRAALWLPYAVLPILTLAWQVTWDPALFEGDTSGWWWPVLAVNRDLSYGVFLTGQIVYIAAIVLLIVLVGFRFVRTRAAERRMLAPPAVAAVVLALATLVAVLQEFGIVTAVDTDLLQNLAMLAVPVAVLVGFGLGPSRSRLSAAPDAEHGAHADRASGGRPHSPVAVVRAHPASVAVAALVVLVSVLLGAGMVTGLQIDAVPRPEPQQAPTPPLPAESE